MVSIIKKIPKGKVATYGQIAEYGGKRRAARQVAYILHSSSEKENLPWYRVVNSKGGIALKCHHGFEVQKDLLEKEGIVFGDNNLIDLERFQWEP